MIEPALLYKYGAVNQRYEKGEMIFLEGTKPLYFYQILAGKVKMMNCSEDGKEFIQGYFSDGESFGEPPLFYDGIYPACAAADSECAIVKLRKEAFTALLKENTQVLFDITAVFARRLKQKSVMAVELAVHEPEHRITTLLTEFKKQDKPKAPKERMQIPFTRQQIADMTGLRVETVIRVVKAMEEKGVLEIRDRKVFF
jgi:CRP-like cAMP-binding protein